MQQLMFQDDQRFWFETPRGRSTGWSLRRMADRSNPSWVCGGLTRRRAQSISLCRFVLVNRLERAHSMVLDPDFCLDVPEGFDDSDAETGVHPIARKLFLGTTAAEAFKKAHEWVREQRIRLSDVSWDFFHNEDEPHCLSIYFTFELDPEDT